MIQSSWLSWSQDHIIPLETYGEKNTWIVGQKMYTKYAIKYPLKTLNKEYTSSYHKKRMDELGAWNVHLEWSQICTWNKLISTQKHDSKICHATLVKSPTVSKNKWPKLYSDNYGLIAGVYKEWQEETWKWEHMRCWGQDGPQCRMVILRDCRASYVNQPAPP